MSYNQSISLFFEHISSLPKETPQALNEMLQANNMELSLGVYRRNIFGAFNEALSAVYPRTKAWLGAKKWQAMLLQHNTHFTTGNTDLNYFGEALPKWVNQFIQSNTESNNTPFLADLAQLEWYVHQAQLTADDPVFPATAFSILAEAPANTLRLKPSVTLSLHYSHYPLDELWQDSEHTADTVSYSYKGHIFAAYRNNSFEATVKKLDEAESMIVRLALQNFSLETIIDKAAETISNPASYIYRMFEQNILAAIIKITDATD